MKIEFSLPELAPEHIEECREALGNFVDSIAKSIELPDGALQKVLVADEASFGPSIAAHGRAEPGGVTHTQTAFHIALGKTIPLQTETGTSNVIILRDLVLISLLAVDAGQLHVDFPREIAAYMIAHELGHCLDHSLRSKQPRVGPPSGKMNLEHFARYYMNILMSEVAACVFSAEYMAQEQLEWHWTKACETAKDLITQLNEDKQAYCEDRLDLGSLAYHVAHGYWVVLLQFAKVYATAMAIGRDLPSLPLSVPEAISEVLTRLDEMIQSEWQQYPQWNDETFDDMPDLWSDLCLAMEFKFAMTPKGVGLYFNC